MPNMKVKSLKVTVATAGTRVPLSATRLLAASFAIQADSANAGDVFIGDVSVTAANGFLVTSLGLNGDDVRGISQDFDLSKIYIDSDTDADAVRVLYALRDNE